MDIWAQPLVVIKLSDPKHITQILVNLGLLTSSQGQDDSVG